MTHRAFRPRAVGELPIDGGRGVRVCYALPPRRAGPVGLEGWWPSFGAGLTLAEATRKAKAEAIERACGVFRGDEPRIAASYRELGEAAIHPGRCLLVSERQRRRPRTGPHSPLTLVPPRFDEEATIDWTPVWSMTCDTWKFLPTMSLYFKYPVPSARRYCPADSNGIAAGRSRPEASLRGLLELVERDSVALWWYNRARRPAVEVASSPDRGIRRLLAFYRAVGRDVWVLDLTSDLAIPVCVAISRRCAGREDLAFGFGAGVVLADAARHALCEMAQVLAVRQSGGRGGAGTAAFESWRRQARVADTPHLLPSPARRRPLTRRSGGPGRTTSRALAWCLTALEARGLEVLTCDLTRAGAPLAVVRMVVPGLRHIWPRFAPGRLYRAPVSARWRRTPLSEDLLNSVPLLL